MKQSKELRKVVSLALAMLLVSVAFVSVVSAQDIVKSEDGSGLSDPAYVRVIVEKLFNAKDNVDELWATLTPEEQAAVLEYLKVKNTVTSVSKNDDPSSGVLSGGCMVYQIERSGLNSLGDKLWSYFQKINWCYDGSKITSKTRLRWGEVYYPGWQFAGHIGNLEQGGVNQWSYRAWTQGEFKLCLGGDIGCVQYKYPWIDMTVYGDGSYTGTGGG
jgi:hypothetical protein